MNRNRSPSNSSDDSIPELQSNSSNSDTENNNTTNNNPDNRLSYDNRRIISRGYFYCYILLLS